LVGGVLSPVAPAQVPSADQDYVVSLSATGAGDAVTSDGASFAPTSVELRLAAHSGPSGENPGGTINYGWGVPSEGVHFSGIVTCVSVAGNKAVIGGFGTLVVDDRFDPPFVSRTGLFVEVVDNGPFVELDPGGQWTFGPDQAGLLLAGPTPPRDCAGVSLGLDGVHGDIVVHDAQRLPTSKNQCKKGGWQTFGVFKNQGDCVSFVATGGQEPAGGKGALAGPRTTFLDSAPPWV
jgi:hypothetical protein